MMLINSRILSTRDSFRDVRTYIERRKQNYFFKSNLPRINCEAFWIIFWELQLVVQLLLGYVSRLVCGIVWVRVPELVRQWCNSVTRRPAAVRLLMEKALWFAAAADDDLGSCQNSGGTRTGVINTCNVHAQHVIVYNCTFALHRENVIQPSNYCCTLLLHIFETIKMSLIYLNICKFKFQRLTATGS